MKNFKPNEAEIIGQIKKQIEAFIRSSLVLDPEVKKHFLEELAPYWNDERFDGTKFLDDAVGLSIYRWQEQNFKLVELWKEIAVNNAKVNNEPHKVADETVARFKEAFNCD